MSLWNRLMGVGWTRIVLPDGGRLEPALTPYMVHPSGKVRNGVSGRELTPYGRGGADGDEYLAVELTQGGEAPGQVYVHQLVAWAFVPGWKPGRQVEHVDGDPHHNAASNLRWIEPAENLETRGRG